jgi:hypothetical protein
VLQLEVRFASCEVTVIVLNCDLFVGMCSSAAQQGARQKVSFNGRVQASAKFCLLRQVIAFQSASDQAASNLQSVRSATFSGTEKSQSCFADTIDGPRRKDYGIGNLSSETVAPAQPPLVDQEKFTLQSSERQSRKNVGEPQIGGGSSNSWSTVPGGRPPLTADEEAEYALHVQVLLPSTTSAGFLDRLFATYPSFWLSETYQLDLILLYQSIYRLKQALLQSTQC